LEAALRRVLFTILILLAAAPSFAAPPKIVVVISIDQFPWYYIKRFAPLFGPNGFNRFLKEGATFTNARYPYAITFTGPGHASIGTGYPPAQSAIAGNNWYEGDHRVYCVDDKDVQPVAGTPIPESARDGLKMSPKNLEVDSLGDLVRARDPQSKVYSVSLKDRAAILMGGHHANAAYWFDEHLPGWVSSTWYHDIDTALLDPAMLEFLHCHPSSCTWTLSRNDLAAYTHDPGRLRGTKECRYDLGQSFPHPIRNWDALTHSPYGNEVALEFAKRLIEKESLGADEHPDLLYISLSSQDYLGHIFGPDSLEAADTVLTSDRDLGAFFDYLQQRFGGRVTVALTADHGMQSIPEVARDLGREAGRVDLSDGAPERQRLDKIAHIRHFEEPWIYLDHAAESTKIAVRDAVRKLPGVSGAWTDTELRKPNAPRAVRLSYYPKRSGDVFVTLKPGWIWNYDSAGTTHGQPVEDDQHVPLLFWGDGIRPGTYDTPTSPLDLARTIGTLIGVKNAGAANTKVLPCIGTSSSGGLSAALDLALHAVENGGPPLKLVLSNQLDASAVAAARGLREIVTDHESLPAGYARLDELDILGDTAMVMIWTGPIPPQEPGKLMLACGTGYKFSLKRMATGWEILTRGVSVC
jgi:predicted AlkP superfamily pyrophosphatase or phosphodiesterase